MRERLEPGARLGRHRIDKLLGAGAMGEAYLATDEVLDVQVVLKVLSDEMLGEEESFQRFKREVLLSRRISHPGICKVFDLHREEERWFLSMEWVEGETLEGVMKREGRLPVGEAARIAAQICQALSAAHQAGVIHRDLKPANIMLRPDREISILDFGLATGQGQQRITQIGSFVGSVHYVAPEVVGGSQATEQSDLYAVGALLYAMVTGKVPFDGTGMVEVCQAVVKAQPTPPSELNPEVEPDLERVILTAMKKHPMQRYPRALDLQTALEAATVHLPDAAIAVQPGVPETDASVEDLVDTLGYSAVLRSQLRKTTLLFSDIVEITPFFDRHGDIEGRKKIHVHNEMLFPIIEAHQGRVVKTIGDAIMAFFELPDEGLEAAIEMQETLVAYNARVSDPDFRIEIRIGLNSGEAIVEENDVYGDAVNVAARVSSQAVGGQILVAQPTVDSLELEWEELRSIGDIPLKGKAASVPIYELIWREEAPARQARTAPSLPASEPLSKLQTDTDRERVPVKEGRSGLRGFLVLLLLLAGAGWAGVTVLRAEQARPKPAGPPAPLPIAADPPPSVGEAGPTDPLPEVAPATPTRPPEVPAKTPNGKARTAAEEMRERGILAGDDRELALLLIRSKQATGRKARARLKASTLARLEQIVVDKAFLEAKTRRLRKRFRDRPRNPRRLEVVPLLTSIRLAIDRGDFEQANRELNRGFEILSR